MITLSPSITTKKPVQGRTKSIYEHVIVVTRKTELEELTARFNTIAQARFYLEHAGRDVDAIIQAHEQYQQVLDQVRYAIPGARIRPETTAEEL